MSDTQHSLILNTGSQHDDIHLIACTLTDVPDDAWFYIRSYAKGILLAYQNDKIIRKNAHGLWPADKTVWVEESS